MTSVMGALSALTRNTSALNNIAGIAGIGQAVAGVASGVAANRAASQNAALQERQAQLITQEAQVAINQKAREIRQFSGQQRVAFASSGVTLEGSPLLFIDETRRLGQEELDAMAKQADARAELARNQAQQTRNQGRAALLGSLVTSPSRAISSLGNLKRIGAFSSPPVTQSRGSQADPFATGFPLGVA